MPLKTFRDEIAIKAMKSLIKAKTYEPRTISSISALAETCYLIADSMIEAKNLKN